MVMMVVVVTLLESTYVPNLFLENSTRQVMRYLSLSTSAAQQLD
jgi:hypothetical protein